MRMTDMVIEATRMIYAEDLRRDALSRDTSDEIMAAIYVLAKDDQATIDRIWQDPTRRQTAMVVGIARAIMDDPSEDLYWGLETFHASAKRR